MEMSPHVTLDTPFLSTEEALRTAATVSASILTEGKLAEGYPTLPLHQLMAQRVRASIEALNCSLAILECHSFTRMTSDWAYEGQGRGFAQILQTYDTLTQKLADLASRLVQERLQETDHLVLATGELALLLPAATPAPAPEGPIGESAARRAAVLAGASPADAIPRLAP
jgi:hypothetical protein